MRGVKISLVGIGISLFGLSFATNNIIAIGGTFLGLIVTGIACFVKELKNVKCLRILPYHNYAETKYSIIL